MTVESDLSRLSQTAILQKFTTTQSINDYLTVYSSEETSSHNHYIYCGLIPSSKIEKCLSHFSWDFSHANGFPGAIQYSNKDTQITEYFRFGNDQGFEPLIIDRNFHGIRPDYKELNEEFRLFHNLYFDSKENKYIKIDDIGNEHVVAIVEPKRIQIRIKEIRQFLAIKEMHLSIQFDFREHSQFSMDDLGVKTDGTIHRDGLICWSLSYSSGGGICSYNSFSRLCGKYFISPLPKEKSGLWGFAEEETNRHVDFIIGISDDGEEIVHTSNPSELANNFGANPDSPHYLTPVYFKKEVLNKYYQQSSKYSVEDSYFHCGSLWGTYIDNHHDDKVCVWLGDLGRDLPYEEQLYWRSYNIIPVGTMSKTFLARQIDAKFTESDRPEHNFAILYNSLCEASNNILGWQILSPLLDEDKHHLKSIRIPSNNEQKDFDELILALTKILIDSINEKELNKFITQEVKSEIKGSISRLQHVLQVFGIKEFEEHIQFLRNLQNLRSAGTAHRKGSNYKKIAQEFNINNASLPSVFKEILHKANEFLLFLENAITYFKN